MHRAEAHSVSFARIHGFVRDLENARKTALPRLIGRRHALNISLSVIAVELDFEVRQPVVVNPFGQSLRHTIIDPGCSVRGLNRIDGRDKTIQRHARLGLTLYVLAWVLTFCSRAAGLAAA